MKSGTCSYIGKHSQVSRAENHSSLSIKHILGRVRRWEVRDKSYQISVIVGDSTQGFINKGVMLLSHPHPVINQICPHDIRRPTHCSLMSLLKIPSDFSNVYHIIKSTPINMNCRRAGYNINIFKNTFVFDYSHVILP